MSQLIIIIMWSGDLSFTVGLQCNASGLSVTCITIYLIVLQ